MSEHFRIARGDDGIVTATFDRPKARNALTFAMYDGLADLCAAIDADASTKALILSGAGTAAFAAGTDIGQFEGFAGDADALAYESRIERVLGALERCRVPTIAAIAGGLHRGGAAIAGCCDLRIGADNLRFGFPIARTLGNCLSTANVARLVALVGEARVKEMIFTARLFDAPAALAIGLVGSIVRPDALAEAAQTLARDVAANAPLTLAGTKRMLARLRASVEPADDLLLECYRSRDFREGVTAFGQKRKPHWRGR